MPFQFLDTTNIPGISQVNSALSSGISGIVGTGTKFPTQMVANTRTTQYSLIFITGPNPKDATTYNFPITPQQYSMQRRSLAMPYDTPGSSQNLNVNRIVDVYGLTPITFKIQGTTGFNKHAVDGFLYSGIESLRLLQKLLEIYFEFAQTFPKPTVSLQFLDFYYQEFWNVVPVGPLVINQSKEKPQLMFYDLTLAGTTRVSSPAGTKTNKLGVINPAASNNFTSLGNTVQTAVQGAVLLAPHI